MTTIRSDHKQCSEMLERDATVLNAKKITFPSFYPNRTAAFIDYLNENGGCNESIVDQLLLEDDDELLVELTCWILDKLAANNLIRHFTFTPSKPSSLSPSSSTSQLGDTQHNTNEQSSDLSGAVLNSYEEFEYNIALNSLFGLSYRFQTQAVITRLGINYGAIPTNTHYIAPLIALFPSFSGSSVLRRGSVHFLWILRSKNCWSNGAEFKKAFEESDYLQEERDLQHKVQSGIISPKHHPHAGLTMRLFELVFFKTFPTVPHSDPPKPTPPNDLSHRHRDYKNFRCDEVFISFDRRASASEFLSWLGLHNDELWFSPQRAIVEKALMAGYQLIVEKIFHTLPTISRQWDYYSYNYRTYDLLFLFTTTNYLSSLIPTTIRNNVTLSWYRTDTLYSEFQVIAMKHVDDIYDLAANFTTKLSAFPQSLHKDSYWATFSAWFLNQSMFDVRLASLATFWHDGPTTAIGTHYLSQERADKLKKSLKAEQKNLTLLTDRKKVLEDLISNGTNNNLNGLNGVDGGDNNDNNDNNDNVDVILASPDEYQQPPTENPRLELDQIIIEIAQIEATVLLYTEQRSFYRDQAHWSLQMYEYWYSRCGFLNTRIETLKALYCLARSKDDEILLERLALTGLNEDNFVVFNHHTMMNYVKEHHLFQDNAIISNSQMESLSFNNDDDFYHKDPTTGLSMYDKFINLTTKGREDKDHASILFDLSDYHFDVLTFRIIGDASSCNPWFEFIEALSALGDVDSIHMGVKLLKVTDLSTVLTTQSDSDYWPIIVQRPQFELDFLQTMIKYRVPHQFHKDSVVATTHYDTGATNCATIWDYISCSSMSDDEIVATFEALFEIYSQTAHYKSTLPKANSGKKVGVGNKSTPGGLTKSSLEERKELLSKRTNVHMMSFRVLFRQCNMALRSAMSGHLIPSCVPIKSIDWITTHLFSPDVLLKKLPEYIKEETDRDAHPLSIVDSYLQPQLASTAYQYFNYCRSAAWRWKARKSLAITTKAILKALFPFKANLQAAYLTNTAFIIGLIGFSNSAELLGWFLGRLGSTLAGSHYEFLLYRVIGVCAYIADYRDLIDLNSLISLYQSEQFGLLTRGEIIDGIKTTSGLLLTKTKGNEDDVGGGDDDIADTINDDPENKLIRTRFSGIVNKATKSTADQSNNDITAQFISQISHMIKTDSQLRRYIPYYHLPTAFISPPDLQSWHFQQALLAVRLPRGSDLGLEAIINQTHSDMTSFDHNLARIDNYAMFYTKYDDYYHKQLVLIEKMNEEKDKECDIVAVVEKYGNIQYLFPHLSLNELVGDLHKGQMALDDGGQATTSQEEDGRSFYPHRLPYNSSHTGLIYPEILISAQYEQNEIIPVPIVPISFIHQAFINANTDNHSVTWNFPFVKRTSDNTNFFHQYNVFFANAGYPVNLDPAQYSNPNLSFDEAVPLYELTETDFRFIKPTPPSSHPSDLLTSTQSSYNSWLKSTIPFTPQQCYNPKTLSTFEWGYLSKNHLKVTPFSHIQSQFSNQLMIANQINRDTALILPTWNLTSTRGLFHDELLTKGDHRISDYTMVRDLLGNDSPHKTSKDHNFIDFYHTPSKFFSSTSPFTPSGFSSVYDTTKGSMKIRHQDLARSDELYPDFYRYYSLFFDHVFDLHIRGSVLPGTPSPSHELALEQYKTFSEWLIDPSNNNDYFYNQRESALKYDLSNPFHTSMMRFGIVDPNKVDYLFKKVGQNKVDIKAQGYLPSPRQPQKNNSAPVANNTFFGFCKWYISTTAIPRIHKSTVLLSLCYLLLTVKSQSDYNTFCNAMGECTDAASQSIPLVSDFYREMMYGYNHTIPKPNTKITPVPPQNLTSSTLLSTITSPTASYLNPSEIARLKSRLSQLETGVSGVGGEDIVTSAHCEMCFSPQKPQIVNLNQWVSEMAIKRQFYKSMAQASTTIEYHIAGTELQRVNDDDNDNDDNDVVPETTKDSHVDDFKSKHYLISTPFETTYSYNLSNVLVYHMFTSLYFALGFEISMAPSSDALVLSSPDSTLHQARHSPFLPLEDLGYSQINSASTTFLFRWMPVLQKLPFFPTSLLRFLIEVHYDQFLSIPHSTRSDMALWYNEYINIQQEFEKAKERYDEEQEEIQKMVNVSFAGHKHTSAAILDLYDLYLSRNRDFFLTQYRKQGKKSTSLSQSVILRQDDHRTYLLELFTPYKQLSQLYNFVRTQTPLGNTSSQQNNGSFNMKDIFKDVHNYAQNFNQVYSVQQLKEFIQNIKEKCENIPGFQQIYNNIKIFEKSSHGVMKQDDNQGQANGHFLNSQEDLIQLNYLWNRFISTLNQYPVMYYGAAHPSNSIDLGISPMAHGLCYSRQLALKQTTQPDLFDRILNRNFDLTDKQIQFFSQWNDLHSKKNPTLIDSTEYIDNSEHISITPQSSTSTLSTLSTSSQLPSKITTIIPQQQYDEYINQVKYDYTRLINGDKYENPNYHITHLPHTSFSTNQTIFQFSETFQPKAIPHIPTSFSHTSMFINGVSILIARYGDVFSGTEFDTVGEGALSTTREYHQQVNLTPTQLIDYYRHNLAHDLLVMNYLTISRNGDTTVAELSKRKFEYLKKSFQSTSWTTILTSILGTAAILGLGAYGALQWYATTTASVTQARSPLTHHSSDEEEKQEM